LNKPLAAAYYMKEDLRQLWSQANKAQAKRFLKDWIARAEASEGAIQMGSDVVYSGVNAGRSATYWAGEQLESTASAARSGAEHASKQIGSLWNSARGRLGW
jgi:hypothetical protein